jgi:hypothetical protein
VNNPEKIFTGSFSVKRGRDGKRINFFTGYSRVVHRISTECGQILCELMSANGGKSTKYLTSRKGLYIINKHVS